MYIRIILGIQLLLCAASLYAYVPNVLIYNEAKGFKAKAVNSMAEDENGKIWIATEQGLWNYDGFKFTQFKSTEKHATPLQSNEIQHIYIDKNQNLWIGYYQHGISIWNLKTGQRKNFHNYIVSGELGSNRIVGFSQTKYDNRIYAFFHDSAWLEFDPITYKYEIVRPKCTTKLPLLFRQIIYIPTAQKWYLASTDGMFLYYPKENKVEDKSFKINNKPVWKYQNSVLSINYHNGLLWQNSWGAGILAYDISTDSFVGNYFYQKQIPLSGATNVILSSVQLTDNTILFASPDKGIGTFNQLNRTFDFLALDYSKNTSAYCNYTFKDKRGNHWIGTENGLMLLTQNYQHSHIIELPLSPSPIMQRLNFAHFIIPFKKYLVTGSLQGSGIYLYDKNSLKLISSIPFSGLKKGETFRSLQAFEYDGKLFINSWSGLYTLDIEKKIWTKYDFGGNEVLKNGIYRCVTNEGDNFLLGFANAQVAWFNPKTKKHKLWNASHIKNEPISFQNSQIFDLTLDRNNNIIAVHESGFLAINLITNNIKQYSYLIQKSESRFKAMYKVLKDKNDAIWICSNEAGLIKFTPGKNYKITKVFSEENGLPGNDITDICLDEHNNVWGLYSDYLFRIDAKTAVISKWNTDNGLTVSPVGWSSINIINQHLYYSVLDKTIQVDKRILEKNLTANNKIYIDAIELNDTFYNFFTLPAWLNLAFNKNSFKVKFGGKHVLLNQNTILRYRLKKQQDWTEIGNSNEINIGNLASGKYALEISSKNNLSSIWSEPLVLLNIKVAHPFYQQGWFLVLMIALIGLIYYIFYRINIQKKQIKASLEKKIDELKMEALRSQMNPHFLFNSLNSINYYIIKNETEKASDYLKKFSKLIRLILNHSKTEIVTLEEELEINGLYIDLEKMRFNNSFDYQLKVSEDIEAENILLPSMLMQPFVENAIWHGLMHKKEVGLLKISISKPNESSILIEIEDNGVGRKRASELKSKSATQKKSYGTEITFERIELFNKINKTWQITFSTEDIKDQQQIVIGTKVNIFLTSKNADEN